MQHRREEDKHWLMRLYHKYNPQIDILKFLFVAIPLVWTLVVLVPEARAAIGRIDDV
jgi:hypothetical protein